MPRYTNDHFSCTHPALVTIAIILRSITVSSLVVNKATVVVDAVIVAIGECLERLDAHGVASSHIEQ